MTKKEVYRLIAKSANYGNLGLFIGAGFSIAVSEISYNFEPLRWVDLLEKICLENNILWNSSDIYYNKSYDYELRCIIYLA